MKSHLLPVILLFLLAPLIAEFLLGNLPVSMIFLVLPLALMYGTGAVLIREVVRQTRRGWPSLILLAVAYSLIEEGVVTQSLFNPNYLHLRLLDYGYVPILGTGIPWLLYVLSIHVIWSISVPISLVEILWVELGDEPWLGRIGVSVVGVVFVAGSALMAFASYQQNPYVASPAQFAAIGMLVIVLVCAAFWLPKRHQSFGKNALHPLILFGLAFLFGSALMALQLFAQQGWQWPWSATVGAALVLEMLFVTGMIFFTRQQSWNVRQCFALMAGGVSVYLWFGFVLDYYLQGSADVPGHAAVALFVVLLVVIAGVRAYHSMPTGVAPADAL